jgi:hypothetical protein
MEFCIKLEEAERAALNRTLTTAQARRLFNEVLERVGDEPLEDFTVQEWVLEWLKSKEASQAHSTAERYRKPVQDFIAHLDKRADLPLRAATPRDVRSFRDALRKDGRAAATVNFARTRPSHRLSGQGGAKGSLRRTHRTRLTIYRRTSSG